MAMNRVRQTLTLMVFAGLAFGCADPGIGSVRIHSAAAASLLTLPTVDLGSPTPASIVIGLNMPPQAFTTKATNQAVASNITYFNIELIQDQGPGNSTDYTDATMGTGGRVVKSGNFLQPLGAGAVGGAIPAGGTNGALRFSNVNPGTYRVRVKAQKDTATPPALPPINKPDGFFTNSSGWTISGNTATVVNGSSIVSYSSGSSLQVNVNLIDGTGDQVDVNMSVNNGAPIPAITSSDF